MDRNETMSREEAVRTISRISGGSVSYAEDLYDSFFPKPVVPQYVADWYEEHKGDFDYELWDYLTSWDDQDDDDDFKEWFREGEKQPVITLVNMHQFGYEVESESRYTVKIKGIDDGYDFLNYGTYFDEWSFSDDEETKAIRTTHTRKELEKGGFGWVFNCEGVEVKEVDDGND